MKAALAEVRAGRVAGIVVAKIDRLGRSSADVLGLVEQAQREGKAPCCARGRGAAAGDGCDLALLQLVQAPERPAFRLVIARTR